MFAVSGREGTLQQETGEVKSEDCSRGSATDCHAGFKGLLCKLEMTYHPLCIKQSCAGVETALEREREGKRGDGEAAEV